MKTESAVDHHATYTVEFYSTSCGFGEFSNFYKAVVLYDQKYYPTSEHAFQAAKFNDDASKELIRKCPTAMAAARKGRDRDMPLRKDWESVKDDVMLQVVTAKFLQHPELADILLSTEDKTLVEHTRNDSYWGDGGDGSGKNKLGQILMQVRSYLRQLPAKAPSA